MTGSPDVPIAHSSSPTSDSSAASGSTVDGSRVHATVAPDTRGADAALLLVALMWGGSYLAAQVMTHHATPVQVLALRFLPSVLVLLGVMTATGRRFTRAAWQVGAVLGLLQAVTLTLETTAVKRTSATNAGVLVCVAVLIAPFLESLVRRRRLSGSYYLCALVSMVGVVFVVGPSNVSSPGVGDVLVLVAACTRALLMVASGHLARGRDIDVVALNTAQTAVNAVLFTAIGAPGLPRVVGRLGAGIWLVLALLSLGCACAAFLLQLWAIRRTSATRASLLMGTEPVWALLAGVVLAHDHLRPLGLVGAVVIIAATWVGQRVEARWRASGAAAAVGMFEQSTML